MDKLIATNRTNPPQNMTAVEDLTTYQKFAQEKADGLNNRTSAFSTLYDAMPGARRRRLPTRCSTPPAASLPRRTAKGPGDRPLAIVTHAYNRRSL